MKVQKTLHLQDELDKARPKCLGQTYFIMEKYDGWYGYIDGGTDVICSRAGRAIPSLSELSKDIAPLVKNGRLIFEIVIAGKEFAITNGILNRKYEQAEDAVLICHDYVPFDHDMPFSDRYELLCTAVHTWQHDHILVAPIKAVSDKEEEWMMHARRVWNKGGEGVILKRADAPYGKAVRNYDLMKIKQELTVDLLVVDLEPGKGKYVGTLGALVAVDSKGTRHTVSGMTDVQRDKWWSKEERIIGSVIEVVAMKWLPDGQLREPRYKAIRHDKMPHEID